MDRLDKLRRNASQEGYIGQGLTFQLHINIHKQFMIANYAMLRLFAPHIVPVS